ncbi:uncharacterized protein METZ01_LOCUS346252, partial [marine metagenome]
TNETAHISEIVQGAEMCEEVIRGV